MALLIGPLVAILGVFAAFVVIRGRARTRKSVYSSLRSDREIRIRAARERALATQPAMAVAPAAAVAPPAPLPVPAPPVRPAWDVSPTSPAPAAAPAAPQFAAEAPVTPPMPTPVLAPRPPEPPTEQQPVAPTAPPAPGRGPAWQPVAQAEKRHLRGDQPGEEGVARESMTQQILSYAGLVAALVVVLLGVVLMVASSH